MPCRGSILVVDDDPDTRDALSSCFEELGCTVTTARDGLDALDQLSRSRPPCLVLLDVNMPRLDGTGFARAVRADPGHCHLPIISMSAGDDHLTAGHARQHLPKPFRFEALAQAIDDACQDSCWLHRER